MEQAGQDIQRLIARRKDKEGFSVLVDFRSAGLLSPEVQEMTKRIIETARNAGLIRSVILLNSALAGLQSKRLASEAGVVGHQRYIDTSKHEDWRKIAVDWLERGVEPPSLR